MGIHIIGKDGKLVEYQKIPVDKEEEIEDFIEKNPSVLEKDMFIIGRQVETSQNSRIDLLGLDKEGNLILIEFKKEKTPRDVVSQILEYAVWAEKIQYEELNRIATTSHVTNYPSLMKKFEKEFDKVPAFFNENQKLYIVSEKIDKKTEDVARYLKTRGVDISCIELNFHESDGQRLADTRIVVGNEKMIIEDYSPSGKKKELSWEEKLEIATEENIENVKKLIVLIKQKFVCFEKPYLGENYFYTKKSEEMKDAFAVLLCGKKTANISFPINSQTFNIKDESIREIKGWWWPNHERRISIIPENYELILSCLEHSYKITKK